MAAESDLNDPRVIRAREADGHGLDAQWSDDFHHALHTVITGERSGYYEDFGTLASDPSVCCRNGAIHLPAESIGVFENLDKDLA